MLQLGVLWMVDLSIKSVKAEKKSFLDGIGNRILALVGVTFLLGTVGVTIFFTQDQEKAILSQHERSLLVLTHTVGSGLQTIMQSGSADIAESYIADIKNVKELEEIVILRIDGKEAFKDNVTIDAVNKRMGVDEFPKREILAGFVATGTTLASVEKAAQTKASQTVVTVQGKKNDSQLTVFYPIPNEESCTVCHGEEQQIRGVLQITNSMQQAYDEVDSMRQRILEIQLIALFMVLSIVFWKFRLYVISPIERLNASMQAMASGNIGLQAEVEGCCEFRTMASCFNLMSHELARTHMGLQSERDKLTTIILGAREGIIATDKNENIVLINPAAERLLGQDGATLREKGFRKIIDDPTFFTAVLEKGAGLPVPDIIFYNDRMLQIQATTIYSNDREMVGSAALLRDVTQEKRLEKELRHLSNTDALTNLYNRRRFDIVLEEEYRRAMRYGLVMGLLLFDVDHFKKFNDTHGHDQGDRVLQAIGEVMNSHFREIDHPCRYGGEEFCAVLPSTGFEGVEIAAERLREKIETMRVDGLQVTISIGVAIYPDSGSEKPEQLLKMADEALYKAKEGGRNQVCFAPHVAVK